MRYVHVTGLLRDLSETQVWPSTGWRIHDAREDIFLPHELTAIAGNSRIREVLFYNSKLAEGMQLAFEFFDRPKKRPKIIKFVELEDREEQRPELLLMDAKRKLEFQFQQLEKVVEADYWFDQINLEEAQERRKALER